MLVNTDKLSGLKIPPPLDHNVPAALAALSFVAILELSGRDLTRWGTTAMTCFIVSGLWNALVALHRQEYEWPWEKWHLIAYSAAQIMGGIVFLFATGFLVASVSKDDTIPRAYWTGFIVFWVVCACSWIFDLTHTSVIRKRARAIKELARLQKKDDEADAQPQA
jgi:hypothetical protein